MRCGFVASAFIAIFATSELAAQQATLTASEKCLLSADQILTQPEGDTVKAKADDFKSLGFGGGYGVVSTFHAKERVGSAQIISGVVRVDKDNRVQFGPVLEMHKFFSLAPRILVKQGNHYLLGGNLATECSNGAALKQTVPLVGVGPFVTLRFGGAEVVQTFGMGVMFGFRTSESDKSLNLGIAFTSDPAARRLEDGIVQDSPLPTGETQIRYKTTHAEGFMVLFSVGW